MPLMRKPPRTKFLIKPIELGPRLEEFHEALKVGKVEVAGVGDVCLLWGVGGSGEEV